MLKYAYAWAMLSPGVEQTDPALGVCKPIGEVEPGQSFFIGLNASKKFWDGWQYNWPAIVHPVPSRENPHGARFNRPGNHGPNTLVFHFFLFAN